jgi:CRP/FNR family transcriptional regulator, cyclic AMP receptor protein
MPGLEHVLRAHPFFANIAPEYSELVAGCARNHLFQAGHYLFHEGERADEFFLIREGRVALEIVAPGYPAIVFQTLGKGEIVGASWLVPPYRWMFDARALEYTRALGLDAECLRGKCETDHDLGYEMMKRFLPVLIQRLHATRLQILDVYGKP